MDMIKELKNENKLFENHLEIVFDNEFSCQNKNISQERGIIGKMFNS